LTLEEYTQLNIDEILNKEFNSKKFNMELEILHDALYEMLNRLGSSWYCKGFDDGLRVRDEIARRAASADD
jgi:hypothetical protein